MRFGIFYEHQLPRPWTDTSEADLLAQALEQVELADRLGFDYVWEVYVPQSRRRWGYYVLPILFGDRLVGRIEPRTERRDGALRVVGLWFEDSFEPLAEPAFIPAFAAALGADRES